MNSLLTCMVTFALQGTAVRSSAFYFYVPILLLLLFLNNNSSVFTIWITKASVLQTFSFLNRELPLWNLLFKICQVIPRSRFCFSFHLLFWWWVSIKQESFSSQSNFCSLPFPRQPASPLPPSWERSYFTLLMIQTCHLGERGWSFQVCKVQNIKIPELYFNEQLWWW